MFSLSNLHKRLGFVGFGLLSNQLARRTPWCAAAALLTCSSFLIGLRLRYMFNSTRKGSMGSGSARYRDANRILMLSYPRFAKPSSEAYYETRPPSLPLPTALRFVGHIGRSSIHLSPYFPEMIFGRGVFFRRYYSIRGEFSWLSRTYRDRTDRMPSRPLQGCLS